MRLKDKVAIITGASRGIGLAIAEGYLREGAKVVIASRKQEALDECAAELRAAVPGGEVLAIAAHTGQMEACQALIAGAVAEFGGVDIVVNNAATNPHFGPMLQAEASHWEKIFEVNVMGYFWMAKFAAQQMIAQKRGGKIINMASIAAIQPGFMMGVYSTSKAAVVMMTKALAQELAPEGIQVNAIAPGFIKTKFSQALWSNPELDQRLKESTPAGRMAEPEELVGAALLLASADSSFITGEVLVVDGGLTLSST
jgi:NAD(P)-dependent dehydrogenase (short-subunit alcohol dehydrogenase family)